MRADLCRSFDRLLFRTMIFAVLMQQHPHKRVRLSHVPDVLCGRKVRRVFAGKHEDDDRA